VNSPSLALNPDFNNIDTINSLLVGIQPVETVPVPALEAVPEVGGMLSHAMAAIEKGFYIFPLGPKSKVPLPGSRGFKDSKGPSDPLVLEPWKLDPTLNIGIDLGASGRTVLDFDNLESIPDWIKALRTFKVGTSRGVHVHCSGSRQSTALFVDGVKVGDLQSMGKYVLAAGSIHPSGLVYTVIDDSEIAPLPDVSSLVKHEKERVNASVDGPAIPHGQHEKELFRIACLLRNAGMDYEQIKDGLIGVCEKRCTDHGSDYVDMCEKKAAQAVKYPVGSASAIPVIGSSAGAGANEETADVSNWRTLFSNVSEMEQGDNEMIIAGVLQEAGTCFLGASAGHGKTLLALSLSKAITLGKPLFGMPEFAVKTPRNVVYLMAESSDRAFRKRCELFGLPKDDRFIARTLTKGLPLALADPGLLEAVRQLHPVIIIDTTSRFNRGGDENSATENRLLANDVVALRAAGALAVVLLHHAKKAATREAMTQENMLRGTSDFAAMGVHTYGLRVDEQLYNHGSGPLEIDLVNLKDRERVKGLLSTLRLAATYMKPGALQPTSYIDETGDFRPVDWAENKDRVRETLNQMVEANPMISIKALCGATKLTPRKVREMLAGLGWHAVPGGPDKRSPWYKDEGRLCPYEEARKKGRKGVVDFGDSEPVFKSPVRVN
jgi:hypothetical protein